MAHRVPHVLTDLDHPVGRHREGRVFAEGGVHQSVRGLPVTLEVRPQPFVVEAIRNRRGGRRVGDGARRRLQTKPPSDRLREAVDQRVAIDPTHAIGILHDARLQLHATHGELQRVAPQRHQLSLE